MDALNPVKEQVERINTLRSNLNLNSVITHIERANLFFERGKKEYDEQYFTDVVYRTNQAFEGCSRQGYMVLAGKSEEQAQDIKAYQIESYFIENNILSDRVLPQFKNYRDNWRNESAHNFKLFFNEEEAYFAILNVLSYAYVLFNQMITKLGEEIEIERLRKEAIKIKKIKGMIKKKGLSLKEKIITLIEYFDKEYEISKSKIDDNTVFFIKEAEVIGMLIAYLSEMTNSEMTIQAEKRLESGSSRGLIADICIEYKGEKLIVELKRFGRRTIDSYTEQISMYLQAASTNEGVVYIYNPTKVQTELKRKDLKIESRGEILSISYLTR
ncbi:hypothetical protein [Winogradskyella sp.]|uniref:hypothetical protein n=1 Tax=Winogradskyella sp. TaxID=1883156 RepID=UPI003BAC0B95